MSEKRYPRIGTGVLVHKDGKVLLAQRKGGAEDGSWCFPGGKLEWFETWQDSAAREVLEETGVEIANVRLAAATNDIYQDEGSHYVTLCIVAEWKSGEAMVTEPEKFYAVDWFPLDQLPQPLYRPTRNFLENGYNPLHSK